MADESNTTNKGSESIMMEIDEPVAEDPLAGPRQELAQIVGGLLPCDRVVGFDTAEGQILSACIEGLLTGENQLGAPGGSARRRHVQDGRRQPRGH